MTTTSMKRRCRCDFVGTHCRRSHRKCAGETVSYHAQLGPRSSIRAKRGSRHMRRRRARLDPASLERQAPRSVSSCALHRLVSAVCSPHNYLHVSSLGCAPGGARGHPGSGGLQFLRRPTICYAIRCPIPISDRSTSLVSTRIEPPNASHAELKSSVTKSRSEKAA